MLIALSRVMPRLDSCPACQSFRPMDSECPNCGHRDRKPRLLRRFLAGMLGVAMNVTLMACYGIAAYDAPYGECERTSECAQGFYCDANNWCMPEDSYCTPNRCPQGWTCLPEEQRCDAGCYIQGCAEGFYCDPSANICVGGCVEHDECGTGFACENSRCVPRETCSEEVGCALGSQCNAQGSCVACQGGDCAGGCYDPLRPEDLATICDEGQTPASTNGELTGECIPDELCAQFSCPEKLEEDCLAAQECDALFTGIHCQDANGIPCSGIEANCQCEEFVFHRCAPANVEE